MTEPRPGTITLSAREAAIVGAWSEAVVDTYDAFDPDEGAVLARLAPVAALADDEPETDDEADAWVLFRLDGARWTPVGDVHETAAAAEAQALERRRRFGGAEVRVSPGIA